MSSLGVHGVTQATNSSGVRGENLSASGLGVSGVVSPAGDGSAIFGDSQLSGTAWAGFFNGDINVVGGTFHLSDARMKKNVTDLPGALEQILALRPVTYEWKQEGPGNEGKIQLGLIAQEVAKIVPEAVRADSKGILAVNYTTLLPVVIKAIQEQQKAVEKQAARIAALEQPHPATASSPLTTSLGIAGAAFGFIPLGLIAARRRKRS